MVDPAGSPHSRPPGAGAIGAVPGEDRDRAVATLVAAFIADPVERWLYPGAASYLRDFGRFVLAFGRRAFEGGTASWLADGSAVALWLPPGVTPDDAEVARVLLETVAAERRADALAVLEQMGAAHPATPHWYLALLGVDPRCQGHGLGGRLLTAGLELVDAARRPAYLETPNPQAIGLYERHGFTVVGRSQAGSCPPITSMFRPARGRPGSVSPAA